MLQLKPERMQTNTITIRPVFAGQRNMIVELLRAAGLPVEDLPSSLDQFLVTCEDELITGIIGMEVYGRQALLRSMLVLPSHRKQGIASLLVKQLEKNAREQGIRELFLLTESAAPFFARLGYKATDRSQAPHSIQQSAEFRHLCPQSAIVMRKQILL